MLIIIYYFSWLLLCVFFPMHSYNICFPSCLYILSFSNLILGQKSYISTFTKLTHLYSCLIVIGSNRTSYCVRHSNEKCRKKDCMPLIEGLVEDCFISSAKALEIKQSCTKPSIYCSKLALAVACILWGARENIPCYHGTELYIVAV